MPSKQVCNIVHGQRCIKKLTDLQTSTMIKVDFHLSTMICTRSIVYSHSLNACIIYLIFIQATARSAPDREKEINNLVSLNIVVYLTTVVVTSFTSSFLAGDSKPCLVCCFIMISSRAFYALKLTKID